MLPNLNPLQFSINLIVTYIAQTSVYFNLYAIRPAIIINIFSDTLSLHNGRINDSL